MHILWPILSLMLHIALCILWAYSVYMQTAPDTIDPEHQNKGAPWYITKNCDIVDDKTIRGYCMQAKSAFAVSVLMLYVSLPIFTLLEFPKGSPYVNDILVFSTPSSSSSPSTRSSPRLKQKTPTKPAAPKRKPIGKNTQCRPRTTK